MGNISIGPSFNTSVNVADSPLVPATASSAAAPAPEPSAKVDIQSVKVSTDPVPIPQETVKRAVDTLNSISQNINRDLRFSIDEQGTHYVQIIDRSTNQVIRQIPDEAAIHLAETLNITPLTRSGGH